MSWREDGGDCHVMIRCVFQSLFLAGSKRPDTDAKLFFRPIIQQIEQTANEANWAHWALLFDLFDIPFFVVYSQTTISDDVRFWLLDELERIVCTRHSTQSFFSDPHPAILDFYDIPFMLRNDQKKYPWLETFLRRTAEKYHVIWPLQFL